MRVLQAATAAVVISCLPVAGVFAADAAQGEKVFKATCVTCHGQRGEGVPNVAPPLKGNEFIKKSSDDEIAQTIKQGRIGPTKRHKEYAGIMPPAVVSAAELDALIVYIRGPLQK